MEEKIIASDLSYKASGKTILKGISIKCRNESLAIIGNSGSGKTTLAKIIAGHIPVSSGELIFNLPAHFKRVFISQQHDFREHSQRSYYQQRFDSNYSEVDSPLVIDELLNAWKRLNRSEDDFDTELNHLSSLLGIDYILQSRLIVLSNGEGKRVQLAKALLQHPEILILDNPFIGLDLNARKGLHGIINKLIASGVIVFLVTTKDEVPENISSVVLLDKGHLISQLPLKDFKNNLYKDDTTLHGFSSEKVTLLKNILHAEENKISITVGMKNVSVSYGDKQVLDSINWQVLNGECWALLGPNGSGKSTLLSLINGDNPQAYGNDIVLFDHKKGSGESIWDIKKKIGYISPELHIYYQRNPSFTESLAIDAKTLDSTSAYSSGISVYEVAASGYNDLVGSSQEITSFQKRQVSLWLEVMGMEQIKNQPFSSLSLGTQRLVLLCRALIKNPPLLILDEPCQGLDKEQTKQFTTLVDEIIKNFHQTLIYVSHYAEDIPSCVNKFMYLEKGRVVKIEE